jgi:Flp pilus assembly protein TadD/cold shock CspA family protein
MLAKHCYSAVAGAYQLRQPLRDNVLASVVGKPLTELYSKTNDSLTGVVEFDCVDSANGIYAARCRHHLIAQIVWERCVPIDEREGLLLALIRALNLAYTTDAQLFDQLVQSDRTIDVLKTLASKGAFFEEACRKQPANPYIRQHYARMLMRENSPELALSEIDSALSMSPNSAPLHHTRGIVLSRIALSSSSPDIARRRMVQAESAFRAAIGDRRRDAYPYHGLALLYFNWAKKFADEQEAVDYVNRAENIVAMALRLVHDRERLLILSSEIEAWFGNQPKSLSILENAAVSSVGAYILGNSYLSRSRFDDAKKLLASALLAEPTNERLALLYAKTLLATGAQYSEVIAVLRLAELYGMRDARFVAMLGGVYFLDGQFTESQKVFLGALAKRFPVDELQAIGFRPRDPGDQNKRIQRTGKIVRAQHGFAYIRVAGAPDIFCRRVRIGGGLLSDGQDVSFLLAFNARGPIGEDLSLVS